MIKEYLAYLRNNPERYWFRRRLFGWGWTPARWPGFFVLFLFLAYLSWVIYDLAKIGDEHIQTEDIFRYVYRLVAGVAALILIAWKTGEKPKWMWGIPKEEKSKKDPEEMG